MPLSLHKLAKVSTLLLLFVGSSKEEGGVAHSGMTIMLNFIKIHESKQNFGGGGGIHTDVMLP
jgi:hypothetical protein